MLLFRFCCAPSPGCPRVACPCLTGFGLRGPCGGAGFGLLGLPFRGFLRPGDFRSAGGGWFAGLAEQQGDEEGDGEVFVASRRFLLPEGEEEVREVKEG